MLAITRRNAIRDQLMERKSVTITDLAKKLNVTKETIRRDLRMMEEQGELIRTHGGAYILDGVQNDIDISMRQVIKTQEKTTIAEKCTTFIQPGDSIFLDGSTTCWFVAQQLLGHNLTVLTNSLQIATILSQSPSIQLIMIGGTFAHSNLCFIGENTCQALKKYYVDKAFLSCRSISRENGITDISEGYAAMHRTVIERSKKSYLVVDSSKLDNTSFAYTCPLTSVDAVICDTPWSEPWREYFQTNGIACY